jgi:hypothetical protein
MTIALSEITLVQTCGACPEQYDAFYNGKQVGYLRLRHGRFRVDYPNVEGVTIYSAEPEGDGCFTSEERQGYLTEARLAIITAIKDPPPAPVEQEPLKPIELQQFISKYIRPHQEFIPTKWHVNVSPHRIRIFSFPEPGKETEISWKDDEWINDPSVTVVIAEAIRVALTDPEGFEAWYHTNLKLKDDDEDEG